MRIPFSGSGQDGLDDMAMPNFLIIGAAKSGTTSLFQYLRQNPDIFMSPIKEPHFFSFDGEDSVFGGPIDAKSHNAITSIQAYQSLFHDVTNERAIGEASTSYLYNSEAPMRIRHYLPNVKLVAILRNPVDRAYSNFLYMTRRQLEPLTDFEHALREEETRIRDHWPPTWHYKRRGFYCAQLHRYFSFFERGQIQIWLYEDLCENPLGLIQGIFQFLGVDDSISPDVSARYNPSGLPRSPLIRKMLRSAKPVKALVKPLLPSGLREHISRSLRNLYVATPPLSKALRSQLVEEYRDDIVGLQELIKRDLSGWLYH